MDSSWIERRRDWAGEQRRAGVEGIFRASAVLLPLPPSLHDSLRVPKGERAVLSPVRKDTLAGSPIARAVSALTDVGASAFTVHMDDTGDGTCHQDILALAQASPLPILCADAVLEPVQIVMARAHGAAAVTLSPRWTPDRELRALYREAVELGLEVVMRVSSSSELETAMSVRLGSADHSAARMIWVAGGPDTLARVSLALPDYAVAIAEIDVDTDLASLDALGYEAFAGTPTSAQLDAVVDWTRSVGGPVH
ncbi:MAG: hypothetical protein ACI81R_000283 [Bradymonadia bacterium]|jgi:hypothetical protein